MNQLPELPSELILVAIDDLCKVELDDRYEVNMEHWHTPDRYKPKCAVCLAGAVLAKTLKHPVKKAYTGGSKHKKVFHAIDRFRKGDIAEGLSLLNISCPANIDLHRYIPTYSHDPKLFKEYMMLLAYDLSVVGL